MCAGLNISGLDNIHYTFYSTIKNQLKTLLILKVYKNCYVCYKNSEVDVQGINMKFRGFLDNETDEACFYPKERSQFLHLPETLFASRNEVHSETVNRNGIYFSLAAAGLYKFLLDF